MPGLIDRLARLVGFERATGGGGRVYWPYGNGDRGPPGSWQMGMSGTAFAPETLAAFSAVYSCVQLISGDIAKLSLQVFQVDQGTSARTLKPNDYYAQLMREPNGYQTSADFLQLYVLSYLLRGNAYAYAPQNKRGQAAELHVLDPRTTRPYIEPETGEIFYRVGQNILAGLPAGTVLPARFIIHHRLPLLPGFPLEGVTPIFAAAASSQVGIQILSQSQSFFANSARPSGALKTDANMSPEDVTRLRTEWEANYSRTGQGKTAVLHGGLDWKPLSMSAEDAQIIETLRFSVEEVGRAFRVPTFKIGDTSKVTYRNSEQLSRAYLNDCLGWHLRTLEQRFEQAFGFPADWKITFDISQLLRTEIDVRFGAYTQSLNAGWQSINEVRAQEGLPPVEGGDEPRVQMQYVPLSQANGPPEPPPAPSTEPPPAAPDDQSQQAFDPARVRALLRQRLTRRAA